MNTSLFLRCRFLLAGIFLALSIGTSTAQTRLPSRAPAAVGIDSQRLEKVGHLIDRFVQDGKHAGAAYLIMRNGVVVEWKQTGVKNTDDGSLIQRDTIYRILAIKISSHWIP